MAGTIKTWVKLLAQGLCAAAIGVASSPVSGQVPCRFEVTVLPNIDCGFFNGPPPVTGLNNLGHVVGWGGCSLSYERAVVWTGGPTWTELPMPPGVVGARAYDINDIGEIVGRMQVQIGPKSVRDHAFLYRNGQMIDLGFLPGGNWSTAYAINNRSQITGFGGNVITGNPALHAFIWEDGVMTDLNLPVGPNSIGYDIDEDGRITGWMGDWPTWSSAFIWHNGSAIDLGAIPGGFTADGRLIANDGQTVVGTGVVPADTITGLAVHAFVWRNGRMEDVGSLPGYVSSSGFALSGEAVVGQCSNHPIGPPPQDTAFIYFHDEMRQLHSMVDPSWNVQFHHLTDSNRLGQFVAEGLVKDEHLTAVLTPVWAEQSDVDADCKTDMDDLLLVINQWGAVDSPADVNADDLVNVSDLIIVIENWTVW